MSDIVERLMICAKFDPDQKEAAEEITRLRAENEKLRGVLDDVWQELHTTLGSIRSAIREGVT